MHPKEVTFENRQPGHELAMPEGLVSIAPGADSDVYCDKNRTIVWKQYGQILVTLSTITKYQNLTRRAERMLHKLPTASFRYNDHVYSIRVDAINPILSVGINPETRLTVATSPYIPGPNEDMLQIIFQHQRDPFFLHELPSVEQERLQVFYRDSQPLFDNLSRYNDTLNQKLRRYIPDYPGHVIAMNEKIRMPDPSTLSLTITDLCAEVTWLNPL